MFYLVNYIGNITKMTDYHTPTDSKIGEIGQSYIEETLTTTGYDTDGNLTIVDTEPKRSAFISTIPPQTMQFYKKTGQYAETYEAAKTLSQAVLAAHYPKGKVYSVAQYWDDCPIDVVAAGLTYKEADEMCRERNNKQSSYYYKIEH